MNTDEVIKLMVNTLNGIVNKVEHVSPATVADIVKDAEMNGAKIVDPSAESDGLKNFYRMSDEVQLTRFRGPDFVKLLGRRPARNGNPAKLYEIQVDKVACNAWIRVDDEVILEISGKISSTRMEKIAVSALHRYIKDGRTANVRRYRSRKEKRQEKAAAEAV